MNLASKNVNFTAFSSTNLAQSALNLKARIALNLAKAQIYIKFNTRDKSRDNAWDSRPSW